MKACQQINLKLSLLKIIPLFRILSRTLKTSKVLFFLNLLTEIQDFKEKHSLQFVNDYLGPYIFPEGAKFLIIKSFNEQNIFKVITCVLSHSRRFSIKFGRALRKVMWSLTILTPTQRRMGTILSICSLVWIRVANSVESPNWSLTIKRDYRLYPK